MSNANYILECRGLSKSYSGMQALRNVDIAFEPGRIVGLLGPNGSGKTTMIKLANGLLKADSGQILIDGNEPGIISKSKVAYLPDRNALPEYMTISQLMDFMGDFFNDFNREKAEEMFAGLNLSMKDSLKKLSKGNREKVQLILTMSREAKVYFLDEPIAGVDPAARDYILKTIISNYSPDSLVVISTHLIADVEAVLDDVVFIRDGEILLHRNADELREEKGMSIDGIFREVFRC